MADWIPRSSWEVPANRLGSMTDNAVYARYIRVVERGR